MKTLKSLLFLALLALPFKNLLAHALWIETPLNGKIGQAQQVNIFYGEYATQEKEAPAKWYSDVNQFSLWLIQPGKEKIKLEVEETEDGFIASFTPTVQGQYALSVVHEAKELGGTTKYEFSSYTVVNVGNVKAQADVPNPLKTVFKSQKIYQKNQEVQFQVLLNNKAFVKGKVMIFSPEGWSKEYIADENGYITFTPIWKGFYLLEASNYEKVNGTHYGKTYDASWQGATSGIYIQ
ncbi:DUF4198 domain-containing protein [Pedobacter glucosidilyticus]|uniref:DUF4198 domain-containing protein n=1 Tax=Pedobacter glucosidilyticus TaxID=1122941 RepID=UPI0004248FB5|nr:DUF4198 domain-containing protein [Pedobacter glucosidilyticus]